MLIASLALKGAELLCEISQAALADQSDAWVREIAAKNKEITNKLCERLAEIKQRQAANAG